VVAGLPVVLSSYPLSMATLSKYHFQGLEAIVTEPILPAVLKDPTLFIEPASALAVGSGNRSMDAELVDCGLGEKTCANATGKICLLEVRGC